MAEATLKGCFMKLRPSSYVLIGIIVIALFFGILALTYTSLKTSLFPAGVCGLIIILAGLELRKELRDKRASQEAMEEDTSELEITAKAELPGYIRTFGWMVGLVAGIFLVGFLISIPIFMFSFMMVHKRGWLKSVGFAALFTGLVYILFTVALQVSLFPGIIFDLF